jgi:hypothetical protein
MKKKLFNAEEIKFLPIKFQQIDSIQLGDNKRSVIVRQYYNSIYDGNIVALPSQRQISKLIK